jgi:hypothetical protein
MKKLIGLVLAMALGGCAQLTALTTASTTTVTTTQAITAANTFDAIESTATGYLVYCKGNPAASVCNSRNRQSVIKAVRAGRSARNQIETSLANGASITSTVYNSLVAAVTTLQASPVTNYTGAQ